MPYYQFEVLNLKNKPTYTSAVFEAENIGYAIAIRDDFMEEHPEIPGEDYRWKKAGEASPNRGGKRTGSGRPKGTTKTEKTKVVRVPESTDIEKLLGLKEDLISLLKAHKQELHPTSPRDERARALIEEIESIL